MLSRLVTAFLRRSKHLLISWLQSPSAVIFSSVQFSSVAQSCPTLCDPMNHSTPGLPVHHQLLEFTQTRVHSVSDTIQPSHPLSSPSLPAVILEPPKMKSLTISIVSPSICHEVMGLDAVILVFRMLSFKPIFSFSSFTFILLHFLP